MKVLLECILSAQEHTLDLIAGVRRIEDADRQPYLEVFDPSKLFKEVVHNRDITGQSRKRPLILEQVTQETFF